MLARLLYSVAWVLQVIHNLCMFFDLISLGTYQLPILAKGCTLIHLQFLHFSLNIYSYKHKHTHFHAWHIIYVCYIMCRLLFHENDERGVPSQWKIASMQAAGGIVAGATTSCITTPLDTIKTRLQVLFYLITWFYFLPKVSLNHVWTFEICYFFMDLMFICQGYT